MSWCTVPVIRPVLAREGITSSSLKFGDPLYSFEELVAEMGSAFLCAQLSVEGEVNHESYLDSWLRVLKSDKKSVVPGRRAGPPVPVSFLLNVAVSRQAA